MSINHEIDGIPEMYFHSYVAELQLIQLNIGF